MLTKRWAVLCSIAAALVVFPISGWATFTMNNMSMDTSGSGQSEATATTVNEQDLILLLEPGFNDVAAATPNGAVTSFQQSTATAWDGTAGASTSGTVSNVDDGVNDGDSVTATTSGSTSASAQKENDPVENSNGATGSLIASGGAGTVNSDFFITETGYMLVRSNAYASSKGSTDATAGTDASASSKGSVTVEYIYNGRSSPETLSLTNANTAAIADLDGDTPTGASSYAFSHAFANGVIGWTDSETTGQAFGSFLNLDSESHTFHHVDQSIEGLPSTSADAAGTLDLDFVYRPLAPAAVFSFVGNVNGSTDSEATVTQGWGSSEAQGIKAAVGTSGTQTDLPTGALAWIAGNVFLRGGSTPDPFDGEGEGHAVNPAVLGEEDFDPDPSMTVGTQYGTFSASIGSSSLTNAEVTATGVADEYGTDDDLVASAFAFAVAVDDGYETTAVPGVGIYDLSGPYAFVGQGSIAAADTGPDGQTNDTAATATVLNVFGTAGTPTLNGALNNGDSSAGIAQDDDLVFQRASSAGADSVAGSNLYTAVAHNQLLGTFEADGNYLWFDIFFDPVRVLIPIGGLDHLAAGFIGGGGD